MLDYLSHVSDSTLPRLIALEQAKSCLLDYREAGTVISNAEMLALAEHIGKGLSPADAADAVQATYA